MIDFFHGHDFEQIAPPAVMPQHRAAVADADRIAEAGRRTRRIVDRLLPPPFYPRAASSINERIGYGRPALTPAQWEQHRQRRAERHALFDAIYPRMKIKIRSTK